MSLLVYSLLKVLNSLNSFCIAVFATFLAKKTGFASDITKTLFVCVFPLAGVRVCSRRGQLCGVPELDDVRGPAPRQENSVREQ